MGWLAIDLGDYAQALASFQSSLSVLGEADQKYLDGNAYLGIGWAHLLRKNFAEAQSAFEAGIELATLHTLNQTILWL